MKKVILPEKHIFRRFIFFLQQVNITGMQLYLKRERSFIKFPVLSFKEKQCFYFWFYSGNFSLCVREQNTVLSVWVRAILTNDSHKLRR